MKDKKCDFPEFLYPKEILDDIKKLKLTKEEQELLGLELVYRTNLKINNLENGFWNYSVKVSNLNSLVFLPYEYVKEVGAFKLKSIDNSLSKLGIFREFVEEYLVKNDKELFNIYNLNAKEYLNLCNYINLKFEIGGKNLEILNNIGVYKEQYLHIKEDKINLGDIYKYLFKILQKIKNDKIILASLEEVKDDFNFNSLIMKWIIKDCFVLSYLNLNFISQFIEIIEEESTDKEYLKLKEKYEEDLKIYEKSSSKFKKRPNKPEYLAHKYLKMTKEGEELLNWYNDYIRN